MRHTTSVRLDQSRRWRWSCMVIVHLVVCSIQTPAPAPPTVRHSPTSCLPPHQLGSVVANQIPTSFGRRAQRFLPKQPKSIWRRLPGVRESPTGFRDPCWWRSIWVCSQKCPRSPGIIERASPKPRALQRSNSMTARAARLLRHRNLAKAAKRATTWEITTGWSSQGCDAGLGLFERVLPSFRSRWTLKVFRGRSHGWKTRIPHQVTPL